MSCRSSCRTKRSRRASRSDRRAELHTGGRLLSNSVDHAAYRLTPGDAKIPEEYTPHEARGLLFQSTHKPTADFQFRQKLSSYALAYWAWSTCYEAVVRAIAITPPVVQNICDLGEDLALTLDGRNFPGL